MAEQERTTQQMRKQQALKGAASRLARQQAEAQRVNLQRKAARRDQEATELAAVNDSGEMTEKTEKRIRGWGKLGDWFQTFCWMHIPIIGFWYMVALAVRKETPEEKRTFARAFLLYRILVLLLAITLLIVFYKMGLDFLEQILYYVDHH